MRSTREAGRMLSPEAIERYRRSAAMAPLPAAVVAEIIETAAELSRRQRDIAKALHSLQTRWPAVQMTQISPGFV